MVAPHHPQNVATLAANQKSNSERKVRKPEKSKIHQKITTGHVNYAENSLLGPLSLVDKPETYFTHSVEADTTQRFIMGNYCTGTSNDARALLSWIGLLVWR